MRANSYILNNRQPRLLHITQWRSISALEDTLHVTTDLGQSRVLAGAPLRLDSAVFPVPTESVLHLLVGAPVRHVGVPVPYFSDRIHLYSITR